MSKFLFLVPPFFGHIFPTLAIGQELTKRGHSVAWVGIKAIDNDLLPHGSQFIVPKETTLHEDQIERILAMQGDAVNIKDDELCEWAFENIWIPFSEIIHEGLKTTIKEYKPDVFIQDECMIAGPICARQLSIPYVTSISIGPGLYFPSDTPAEDEIWLTKRLMGLQEKHGIHTNHLIFDSPDLNLVYTARAFALGGDRFPDHYKFLGPIVDKRPQPNDFDWDNIKNKNWPTIYVSLGTVLRDMSAKFLGKVVDGLKDQQYNVIISTDPTLFDTWPENFYVQSYIPQTDILPKVDILISTGGYNTVNEALLFGKPMLVIPFGNDQNGNSYMVVNYGCGIRMRSKRMNGEKVLEAVRELLENEKYRITAQNMSEKYEKGGASEASHLLENFKPKSI